MRTLPLLGRLLVGTSHLAFQPASHRRKQTLASGRTGLELGLTIYTEAKREGPRLLSHPNPDNTPSFHQHTDHLSYAGHCSTRLPHVNSFNAYNDSVK